MDVYGGYIRVSSVGKRDREKFLSPGLQRDRIEGWVAAGRHRLGPVVEDLDVSGGRVDREHLEALVAAVERGELAGLVARLDRFARNLLHGIALIERIDRAGGKFVSVADGFDTSTPYGKLALNIMLSIAQFELERFRENWREARAKMIEQGRHYGPSPPLGYERDEDGRLAPGPLADTVAELFARRASGESLTVLARWLVDRGVRTARDGTPSARYVAELVANRVYLGQARAGEFVNEQAHQPLVDRITWERAQTARAPRPTPGEPTALAGLLRCHGCRHTMSAAWSPIKGGDKRAYRCRRHHSSGRCPAPAFALEEQLWPIVERQFLATVAARATTTLDRTQIDALTAARDQARSALLAYRDGPEILAALGAADYADGLHVRRAALDSAEAELAAQFGGPPDELAGAADLHTAWPHMDAATRRALLHAAFDTVVVRKPTVHRSHSEPLAGRIAFIDRGKLPADTPRAGRKPQPIRPFRDLDDPTGPWMLALQPAAEDRSDKAA